MAETAYKRCYKCGETKGVDQFFRDRSKKDGLATSCKNCRRIAMQKWRRENPERAAEHTRNWARKNPEHHAPKARRYRKKYPKKARAHEAVTEAIQTGKLTKPDTCEDCGQVVENPRNLHAHHEDYSKQLEVEWLCRTCHLARHRSQELT